jgi:hypothetical protein
MPTDHYEDDLRKYRTDRPRRLRRVAKAALGPEVASQPINSVIAALAWSNRKGELDPAVFRNALEAADVGADGAFSPVEPERPTDARPGSPAKLAAMAARIEAGEELWHEEDGLEDDWSGAE